MGLQETFAILCSLAAPALVYWLLTVSPAHTPRLGRRGQARRQDSDRITRIFDLPVRILARHFSRLPIQALRLRIDARLRAAGYYRGWTADEFLAVNACSCIFALGCVSALGERGGPWLQVVIGCAVASMPLARLEREISLRRRKIDAQLPMVIELASLCTSAGADFPAAIEQVCRILPVRCPLRNELLHLLYDLSLGRSRHAALAELAVRVPTRAIREFSGTVCQAETKGAPVSQVLRIQAESLRNRRSVRAEEAAARAGVMLMIPLMMLFACILILVLGPMAIRSGDAML